MAEGGGEVVAVPASGAANGLSNGAGGVPAQTSNPLSRKLNKILETRLDNDKVTRAGRARGPASPAELRLAGGGVCSAPTPSSLRPSVEGTADPRDPTWDRRCWKLSRHFQPFLLKTVYGLEEIYVEILNAEVWPSMKNLSAFSRR